MKKRGKQINSKYIFIYSTIAAKDFGDRNENKRNITRSNKDVTQQKRKKIKSIASFEQFHKNLKSENERKSAQGRRAGKVQTRVVE